MNTRINLSRFCELYVSQRLNLSDGAADQLRVAVRAYDRFLQRRAILTDLTAERLVGFLRAFSMTHSPATVNSRRQALLTLWRSAADQHVCPWPPRIPKLIEPERLPVAWTVEEFATLFRAASRRAGTWYGVPARLCWRAGLLILWDTAVRIGTLLGAEVAQVDFQAATWRVPAEHQKGKRRDRLFRLHPQTVAAIVATTGNGRTSTKLFPYPFHSRQLWVEYKRLLRAAGLPCDRQRMFHCLRRTAESYAAAVRGIEWAAAAVGHSPAVARKHYISPMIYQPPALVDALPRPEFH